MLARIPLVMLVNNNVPANTVKEFVAYAKTPGKNVSYGSPGVGTSNHLYFEVLKEIVGRDVPHVPYKGGGPALTDLLGGQTQALQQCRETVRGDGLKNIKISWGAAT